MGMPNMKIKNEELYARALDDLRFMTLEQIEERLIMIEEGGHFNQENFPEIILDIKNL